MPFANIWHGKANSGKKKNKAPLDAPVSPLPLLLQMMYVLGAHMIMTIQL